MPRGGAALPSLLDGESQLGVAVDCQWELRLIRARREQAGGTSVGGESARLGTSSTRRANRAAGGGDEHSCGPRERLRNPRRYPSYVARKSRFTDRQYEEYELHHVAK